ncbi:histidinol dehydrogenase [Desulfoluna limicola]|uniref:Histidinol dehydrogenase n=1 Tax=Desulfoluna limicola TaxID=2810562 RepID=A0ABN6F5Y3_9BACT|nr:histidinol dehydrogenase [Desulfoluna limicola]BCS97797.1 histidinol dehydrogenase [Desulfoluna limicola]
MEIFKYPSEEAEAKVRYITDRGLGYTADDEKGVIDIIEAVRKDGDEALLHYIRRFDAPEMTLDQLVVTEAEIDAAVAAVDEEFMAALDLAVAQVESFHRKQLENSWIDMPRKGVTLGQMVNPVDAAGVYVPGATGGMTPLVSSVLMGAIPAKIAGVKHIAMVTPPMADGSVNKHLLAAARRTGVDVVYKAGSAWAVAALAYGTESVGKVDVIVGPGNIYVTLAKKLVSGTVGIDMIAGPSEILAIADESANPVWAAADLLSQAEHDPLASSIFVTTDAGLAEKVKAEVARQLGDLPRKEIAEASIRDYGAIMVTDSIESACELANRLAPEHLELLVKAPFEVVGMIRNAGAVFMGHFTPEPMGDYVAGPNHVLPTAGTARFSSALSVENFTKKSSLICYSEEAFHKEAEAVMLLAETEGLSAHARSVKVRLS